MKHATAIDSHAHVFVRGLPLAPVHRYVPDYDARVDDHRSMLDTYGFVGGVLVQPSFLGTDNHFLIDAVARMPDRLRGVAVVEPNLSLGGLAELIEQGIVGLRFNLIGETVPDFAREPWRGLLRRAGMLGFHLEVQSEAARMVQILPYLLEVGGPGVVIDHFGLPDPDQGRDDPAYRRLLAAAADSGGRVWMKISGAYRLGPLAETLAPRLIPLVKQAFGVDRLMFGTDWPHTRFEDSTRVAKALQDLDAWFPDEAERHSVLFDTAKQLFGF